MTCNDGKLIEQKMQPCEQLDCERKAEPAPWQHTVYYQTEDAWRDPEQILEGFYHSECLKNEISLINEMMYEYAQEQAFYTQMESNG